MKLLILVLATLTFSAPTYATEPKYCNGQKISDHWGTYYPNGQVMKDNWGTYYPNRQIVKDNRSVYFPNGQPTADSWGTYYPNKQVIKDSRLVYYHTGQSVKNSWGECYYSNGATMFPCKEVVDAKMWINQGLTMSYKLDHKNAKIYNLKFEEYVAGTRTLYDLSLTDGTISNVEVFCDRLLL